MKYKLILVLLCINTLCYAQNAGWAGYDASEFVNSVKRISNNLKIEQNIKQEIKNNQDLQLQNLQDPWLEEFQRLIKFSIKQDKVEAVKALFDYVDVEYAKEAVVSLKQMALETVIEESKHITKREDYPSINPHAIGFIATSYNLTFDIEFIKKYIDILLVPEINIEKLKKVIYNNSSNTNLTNVEEVLELLK